MAPPCSVTMRRTMARPTPLPRCPAAWSSSTAETACPLGGWYPRAIVGHDDADDVFIQRVMSLDLNGAALMHRLERVVDDIGEHPAYLFLVD